MLWEQIKALLWCLVCIILIIGWAYWMTQKKGGMPFARNGIPRIEPLAQLNLGRNERVAVIKAAQRYFLVGVTAGGISMLAELTAEEIAAWQENAKKLPEKKTGTFLETMDTLLKKNRRE